MYVPRISAAVSACVLLCAPVSANEYHIQNHNLQAVAHSVVMQRSASIGASYVALSRHPSGYDGTINVGPSLGIRSVDTSAKEGNAEHPNFLVPNYGSTSGGPAY